MFQHLPSLKSLHAFESAARHSSFVLAAQELAVSPGAISYQIKQLEESLAKPLFIRKTRQVVLTEAGELLFRTVHQQFRDLDSALALITPGRGIQALTVSVSTYFVTRWLSPRMGRFLTSHPNVVIRLQHSVNDPDFRLEDTDIAIKWGDGQWENSYSQLLFALPMIAVCSPALMQKGLRKLEDLQNHTLLRDQSPLDYWAFWLNKAGVDLFEINGPVIVDPNVRVQSAIDAQGLVLANPLISNLLESGSLCEPFNVRLEGYGYYLVYSDRVVESPAFQIFQQWLQTEVDLVFAGD